MKSGSFIVLLVITLLLLAAILFALLYQIRLANSEGETMKENVFPKNGAKVGIEIVAPHNSTKEAVG